MPSDLDLDTLKALEEAAERPGFGNVLYTYKNLRAIVAALRAALKVVDGISRPVTTLNILETRSHLRAFRREFPGLADPSAATRKAGDAK